MPRPRAIPVDTAETQSQPPALAVWEYAGLMITYWCSARCAFCYVYSGPERRGEIATGDVLRIWGGLDELAAAGGKTMRIHLAGGEPFSDWVGLVSVIRAAHDAGLTRLEKVETNAFWATDDNLTRARIELLAALGMEKLVVSTDVYHQEFVPIERVRRCVESARDVLGKGRVRVRWWDFYREPVDVRRATPAEKAAAFAKALARHKERLTGRAAEMLIDHFPRHPAEHFAGEKCVNEVLHSRHVHVDPYGNVFPGVCAGIVLGNALERGIPELWHDLSQSWREHPVVGAVAEGGSYELMLRALPLGYEPLAQGYANKCHLCQHVRQFLHERGGWERWVGPAECYATPREKVEAATFRGQAKLTVRGQAVGAALQADGS